MALRKIVSKRTSADAETYVGHLGEMWFDPENPELRVSDGVAEGGISIGGNSVSLKYLETINTESAVDIEADDQGKMYHSVTELGIPLDSDIDFEIGTVFTLTTGQVTGMRIKQKEYEEPEGSLSIYGIGPGLGYTSNYWTLPNLSVGTLIKVGANMWYLSGVGLFEDD